MFFSFIHWVGSISPSHIFSCENNKRSIKNIHCLEIFERFKLNSDEWGDWICHWMYTWRRQSPCSCRCPWSRTRACWPLADSLATPRSNIVLLFFYRQLHFLLLFFKTYIEILNTSKIWTSLSGQLRGRNWDKLRIWKKSRN